MNPDVNRMRICLEFSPDQGHIHRLRLEYAFRVFCAIYGHEIVASDEADSADALVTYVSENREPNSKPALRLSNLYRCRPITNPAPSS